MQEVSKLYRHVSKYQHVERLGNSEVQGILQGEVWIQEKLDGANLSVSWDKENDDFIICSRQNVVYHSGECHNKSFQKAVDYIKENEDFKRLLSNDPTLILRGEYLTKHKVPFKDNFAFKVAIYDIERAANILTEDGDGWQYSYYSYNSKEYQDFMRHHPDIIWVPALPYLNPDVEKLIELSKEESSYMEYREGIVIKNYNFVNKYGRVKWGKVISPVFDEKKALKEKAKLEVGELETAFVEKYVTPGYVEKEIHKIRDDKGEVSIKDMGQIMGRVPYEIFQDEMWRFLNKNNAATLNFIVWRKAVVNKVREYALSYFNCNND